MVTQVGIDTDVFYPESDGKPMADNTKQFRWIVTIKENLELLFADDPNVFVAGDLLWYPVRGNNKISAAPDAMVVVGRPKGDRGSYKQWEEGNLPPQVVFEILSPCNTRSEMERRLLFYLRHGVEEYYIYDPDDNEFTGYLRSEGFLDPIPELSGWVSPCLQIRFETTGEELEIYRPDDRKFLTFIELDQQIQTERQQAEEARQQAEEVRQRADRLAEHLRSLGIDPDEI